MTFDELNQLIVAVRATKISFDFFTRSAELIIEPEYGVKEAVKEKVFKLNFNNCFYFGGITNDKLSSNGGMEFIVWGRINSHQETNKLLNSMYTIDGSYRVSTDPTYFPLDDYYFENVFGDVLRIISSEVKIEEVK